MGLKRTDEFRADAVRIALTSGMTRKQVASDLGVGLLILAFALFRPGLFWSAVEPRYESFPGSHIEELVTSDVSTDLQLVLVGKDFETGEAREVTIERELKKSQFGIESEGFSISVIDGKAVVEERFGGRPDPSLRDFDFYADDEVHIANIRVEPDRPAKDLVLLFALIGAAALARGQIRRKRAKDAMQC